MPAVPLAVGPGAEELTGVLVGFARALRAAGVAATPDRVHTFIGAVDALDVGDAQAVYWAGRATLCSEPADLDRYDRVFRAWFAGRLAPPLLHRPTRSSVQLVAVPDPGSEGAAQGEPDGLPAVTASPVEVLRQRDLATLSAAERAVVRRLIAAIGPTGPQRPARRHRPAGAGALDPARTVRQMLRHGGEPSRLQHRVRLPRPRRLVLVLDISGSMRPYADAMLRFAHAAARARPGTEVFTLGTRLTRVSRPMREREPDAALRRVADTVPDFSGGTRLGELVKAFLDQWGQRGMARGAVVVLASDGWERGGADLLGEQMARLHRLAHRVVWVNPHKGKDGYAPLTAGMVAALPHVDDFVAGHTLATLEQLAGLLAARTGGGTRA